MHPLTAQPGLDGDWVTVELALPVLPAVRGLLAFGDRLEILAPPQARAELAEVAEGVAGLYAN
ncbi:hypothetical protein ACWGI8_14425 [Streptomyces sp. NPDC054841]